MLDDPNLPKATRSDYLLAIAFGAAFGVIIFIGLLLSN